MKTNTSLQLLARALRKGLSLTALILLCAPAVAQEATLLAYWNFNDASDTNRSVATVGGFVGLFTNNNATAYYATNNPVYTADAGGFSGQPGDRALNFGLNQNYRLMRCTDIAAALNVAAANDKITLTFRQKWNTATATSSSFWFTSPSVTHPGRGFHSHCPYGGTTVYFDTAGCCTATTQRLSGGVAVDYRQWRLFTFVKNGGAKQVLVDGTVYLQQASGANPLPTDFTEILLGAAYVLGTPTNTAVGNNIRGALDDFAIWQGALTPNQMAALNRGLTPDQIVADSDGDGMPNWYEDQYSFNKNQAADAAQDADIDGLTNLQEYQKGTDPRNRDTDGDGLADGVETGTGGYTSTTDTGTNPLDSDTDDDLLLDGVEDNTNVFVDANRTGTNPNTWDSDGDGFGDGAEVALGSLPVNASSTPSVGTGTRILAYWDFNTNTAPTQAVDRVHSLLADFTNGVVYTEDAVGHTAKPGDRAIDFGTTATQRIVRSRAIAPYLQAAVAFDPVSSRSDEISISFWQKWSVVPVGSSTFWIVSPSMAGNRGMQAHNPNGGVAGPIYFDTAGCCGLGSQRLVGTNTPAGFDWQQWHHFAFIKSSATSNNGEKQLWIDGRMITNTSFALPLPADFTELILGATYPAFTAQFRGLLDDFAVYGSTLTTNQIEALAYGLSPLDVEQATGDADSDGMPDGWEYVYGFNKNNPADAALDADSDGSTNLQEYQRRTDPRNMDTDADGLRDGIETKTGVWASASDTGTDPLKPDTDGDSLPDGTERNTGIFVSAADPGTSPVLKDTDADGYSDPLELFLGSNPVSSSSIPITVGGTNLLAYWDFNDATVATQALDRFHGYVGVFEGDAVFASDGSGRTSDSGDRAVDFGTNGTALVRNTTGQWLNAAAPNDAITISFWEKWTTPIVNIFGFFGISPSSADSSRGLSAHSPYGDGTVYWDTGGTTASNRISVNAATINTFIPGYTNVNGYFTNQWRHFAFVRNGTIKQIWMDGVRISQGTNTVRLVSDFTQFLMGNIWNANSAFHGLMDDFAVYASALDATNIVALAQGASPIDFSMPVLPPTLSIAQSGNDIVLSWTGTSYIVQTNANVTNPAGWVDVPGATTSPSTQSLLPTESRYFRLKKQ